MCNVILLALFNGKAYVQLLWNINSLPHHRVFNALQSAYSTWTISIALP